MREDQTPDDDFGAIGHCPRYLAPPAVDAHDGNHYRKK